MLIPRRPEERTALIRQRTVREAVGTMNTLGQSQARFVASGPVAIAGPDGAIGVGAGELNPNPTLLDPGTGLPVEAESGYWQPSVHPIGSRPLGGRG